MPNVDLFRHDYLLAEVRIFAFDAWRKKLLALGSQRQGGQLRVLTLSSKRYRRFKHWEVRAVKTFRSNASAGVSP